MRSLVEKIFYSTMKITELSHVRNICYVCDSVRRELVANTLVMTAVYDDGVDYRCL